MGLANFLRDKTAAASESLKQRDWTREQLAISSLKTWSTGWVHCLLSSTLDCSSSSLFTWARTSDTDVAQITVAVLSSKIWLTFVACVQGSRAGADSHSTGHQAGQGRHQVLRRRPALGEPP